MTSERPSSPIASSIDMLRRQFGLGRAGSLQVITEQWPDLAGEAVAAGSEVIDLRAGTLTVNAYDPRTAEVLNWSKTAILDGVRASCPDERIEALAVRVRRRADSARKTGENR